MIRERDGGQQRLTARNKGGRVCGLVVLVHKVFVLYQFAILVIIQYREV